MFLQTIYTFVSTWQPGILGTLAIPDHFNSTEMRLKWFEMTWALVPVSISRFLVYSYF